MSDGTNLDSMKRENNSAAQRARHLRLVDVSISGVRAEVHADSRVATRGVGWGQRMSARRLGAGLRTETTMALFLGGQSLTGV